MTTIRLRGPEDLLATLPFQLGYQPADSVVVVALHDRRLGMVARVDLPPPGQEGAVVEVLVPPVVREGAGGVMLVGYETDAGASRQTLDALADAFGAAQVPVARQLVVRDARWYDLGEDGALHPPGGAPVPAADRSPAAAEYVALGVAPLSARADLGRLVAAAEPLAPLVSAELAGGPPVAHPGEAFGLPEEPSRRAIRRMEWLTLWARLLDVRFTSGDPDLSPAEVAQLVRSLVDVELRDGVIAWICPGTLPLAALELDLVDLLECCLPPPTWDDGDGREAIAAGRRLLDRLRWLCRAVPDEHGAGALTVLAQFAWWLGDGAMTRVALDRALEHQPDYRLALLLERMVDLGVRERRSGRDRPPDDESTHRTRLSAG